MIPTALFQCIFVSYRIRTPVHNVHAEVHLTRSAQTPEWQLFRCKQLYNIHHRNRLGEFSFSGGDFCEQDRCWSALMIAVRATARRVDLCTECQLKALLSAQTISRRMSWSHAYASNTIGQGCVHSVKSNTPCTELAVLFGQVGAHSLLIVRAWLCTHR